MSTAPIITKASEAIAEGKLVIFPTETVYGLGANALDAKACAAIFQVKDRPHFNPLIVHIADPAQVTTLTTWIPPKASTLMLHFWPGPLTLVLPKSELIPDIVTAGLGTVALRIPDHAVARVLLEASGLPIAAPSANRFQHLSPTDVDHIDPLIRKQAAVVLDGGPSRVGLESTIIGFQGDMPYCLRLGGLSLESIESVVGPLIAAPPSDVPLAPGMFVKHYSPRKPLILWNGTLSHDPSRCAFVSWQQPPNRIPFGRNERLSASGDLKEAAARLFSVLRSLDESEVECIYAELVPDIGLGRAINDRLRRAATSEIETGLVTSALRF